MTTYRQRHLDGHHSSDQDVRAKAEQKEADANPKLNASSKTASPKKK